MKKSLITTLILIVLTLSALTLLSACSEEPPAEHTHGATYTSQITTRLPTCTSEGSYDEITYCSDCHKMLGRVSIAIDIVAHTPGDWIMDVEPTCDSKGAKHKECTVCHAKLEDEVVAERTHILGSWITDSEPTCAVEGTKHRECTLCHKVITQGTIEKSTTHTPGEWVIDKNPTCGERGETHVDCTVCGITIATDSIYEYIPHTPGERIIDKEPTCAEDGAAHRNCTVCGQIYSTSILHKNNYHSGEWSYDGDASVLCHDRFIYRNCAVCGLYEERYANYDDHKYETVTIEPTCWSHGYDKHTCSACGYVENSNYTDPLGHSLEAAYSYDESYHWIPCKRCEYQHNYSSHNYDVYGNCTDCLQPMTPTSCIQYTLSDDGSYAVVTGYDGYAPNYIIANTYMGVPVTEIADGAFRDLYTDYVYIPENITHIGARAFLDCRLDKITIGKGVKTIESNAFSRTSSSWNDYDLYITDLMAWCYINFEDAGANPFIRAENLYVNGNLTKELVIPYGTTTIKTRAFCNCKSITSLIIPDTVVNIEENAFAYSNIINKVTVGSGVKSIAHYAFGGCTNIEEVRIRSLYAWCNISFESQYSNPLQYADVIYVNGSATTKITIPSGIKTINQYAFYDCTVLEGVTIPGSVEEIDNRAFRGCTGLKNLTLPDNISVNSEAFYNCEGLESVIIGDNVKIWGSAFEGCKNLASVTLLYDTAYITSSSFANCNSALYTDDGICQYIGDAENPYAILYGVANTYDAFYSINPKTKVIASFALSHWYSLVSITLPESLTYIANHAFSTCPKLVEVINHSALDIKAQTSSEHGDVGANAFVVHNEESSKITNVDGYLFYERYLLGYVGNDTDLVFPESYNGEAYDIYNEAFYQRNDITSVVIFGNNIGKEAFYGCKGLISVTISNTVGYIDDYAFENCTNLTSLNIIGMRELSFGYTGYCAFRGCTSLKEVTLGEGVKSIGGYSFYGCTSLENIVFPESLTSIGNYAFYQCSSLTSVSLPDSVAAINSRAFAQCTSLTSVSIGAGVSWIGIYAFEGCDNLATASISDRHIWYIVEDYTSWSNREGGERINLPSESDIAILLKYRLRDYYWYKIA